MSRKVIIGDCTLYNCDCNEILPPLKNKVDLVVTDPTYGIAYRSNHRRQRFGSIANDEKPPTDYVTPIVDTLKQDSAIYLCSSFAVYSIWERALRLSGATIKTPICWDKGNWTAGDLTCDYGNQVELILYAIKGRPRLRQGRDRNLWHIPRVTVKDHPTPKPVELMRRCVLNSSDPDDLIFDPFLGSGPTAIACIETGRRFVGCEIDGKYFEIACARIADAVSASRRPPPNELQGER